MKNAVRTAGGIYGKNQDIYNPWSILDFLDKDRLAAYWANTSSNSLIGRLIRSGNRNVKMIMEDFKFVCFLQIFSPEKRFVWYNNIVFFSGI